MKFTIAASFLPPVQLRDIAVAADACGWTAMSFSDHVVHPETLDTPYPYTEDGSRRWEAFTDWPDPWVTIGALSSVTSRLRFNTNVFVLPMRNVFMAAKAVSTAAVLSGDRVTLTVGVGWSNVEFDLVGQDFRTRGKRTDEMIEVMRKLWTGEMVEHQGRFFDFDRLEMNPAPRARIPIWVGGISDPALRRAARLGDGWLTDLQTTAEIAERIDTLNGYRRECGRENEPFDIMATPSDAYDLDGYKRVEDLGVTHLMTMPWMLYHGDTQKLDERIDGVRRFADDVIAKLG
ncbi:MAG: LLM class F420-dependent oxidoreductase [Myxococcales bacterium]|nr:LLM class F420-dependent oxidoreductase [Myxococcales bacterium]